jgi:phage shock protein A
MDQIEMKQMLEHLMGEMKATQHKMDSSQHEMKTQIGSLASKMDATEHKMEAIAGICYNTMTSEDIAN